MLLIILMYLILFEFIAWNRDKKSPLSMFLIMWILILLLYRFKLYGIYSVSDRTLMILTGGIFCFVLGYTASVLMSDNANNRNNAQLSDASSSESFVSKEVVRGECINLPFIRALTAITIVASIPQTMTRLIYLVSSAGSIQVLKDSLITGDLTSSSFLQAILVNPLSVVIMFLSTYFIINDRTQKLVCLGGIYFVAVDFALSGSKITVVYFALGLVVNAFFSDNFNYDFKRLQKRIKWLVVFAVIFLLVYMYSYKGGEIYKSLYYYLCGCLPMLDKVVMQESYFSGLTSCYGCLSFYSIFNIINGLFKLIGINVLDVNIASAENYLALFEKPNYAGEGVLYNAFSTFVSYPYIDFGLIGMLIFCFIYGLVIHRFYLRFQRNRSISNTALICFVYVFVITSMIRFQFSNYKLGLGFIYLFMLRNVLCKSSVRDMDTSSEESEVPIETEGIS